VSQSSKPGRKTSDNNRTINDYFGKPTSSPGRGPSGAKSPSPNSNQFLPCSPQPTFMSGMGDFRMQPPAPRPGQQPVPRGPGVVKATQTDLTVDKVEELETRSSAEIEVQGAKIDELTRRLASAQKTIDSQKETISRCLSVAKEIIIK